MKQLLKTAQLYKGCFIVKGKYKDHSVYKVYVDVIPAQARIFYTLKQAKNCIDNYFKYEVKYGKR